MNRLLLPLLCLGLGSGYAQPAGVSPARVVMWTTAPAFSALTVPEIRATDTVHLWIRVKESGYISVLLLRPDQRVSSLGQQYISVPLAAQEAKEMLFPGRLFGTGLNNVVAVHSAAPINFAQAERLIRTGRYANTLEINKVLVTRPAISDVLRPAGN